MGLLIHSGGGQIIPAYQIVRLFQRRTDDIVTIVPLFAKSAATLIAIGGKEIVMASESELGPLDVQIWDTKREERASALETVQSFDRLDEYAMNAFDKAMKFLLEKTGKLPGELMPLVSQYAISMVGPLAQKIDTVELSKKYRALAEGEEYAKRVMRPNYTVDQCRQIARNLVRRYPTHSFVIDRAEAGGEFTSELSDDTSLSLGLHVTSPSADVEKILSSLVPDLRQNTIIGQIVEIADGSVSPSP